MSSERGVRDLFHWRSAGLLIGIAIGVLLILKKTYVAGGVALGFGLYAANLLLLLEVGRASLRKEGASRPKVMAALSSTGRMLFLAIALSMIAVFLGREAVLGACGGLLIAQVNLHVPRTGR